MWPVSYSSTSSSGSSAPPARLTYRLLDRVRWPRSAAASTICRHPCQPRPRPDGGSSMRTSTFAATDTGLVRTGNEDSSFRGDRVLAVADGLGGHLAGEVASAIAIAAIAE